MLGIIGAMDEEVDYLLSQMSDVKQTKVANCLFVEGYLSSKKVVLLKSGIGKVNAAMATTILHERFSPGVIINTGSAGGLDKHLNVGDIVISDEIVHHDVDVTSFDYDYGQVPGMPPIYLTDTKLNEIAKTIMKNMDIPTKTGMIVTGDSFMNDADDIRHIQKNFPQAIAAEMEAAAIAQVCYQYDSPFIVIRALSDIAGKKSSQSFESFLMTAAKHSSEFIIEMIRHIDSSYEVHTK